MRVWSGKSCLMILVAYLSSCGTYVKYGDGIYGEETEEAHFEYVYQGKKTPGMSAEQYRNYIRRMADVSSFKENEEAWKWNKNWDNLNRAYENPSQVTVNYYQFHPYGYRGFSSFYDPFYDDYYWGMSTWYSPYYSGYWRFRGDRYYPSWGWVTPYYGYYYNGYPYYSGYYAPYYGGYYYANSYYRNSGNQYVRMRGRRGGDATYGSVRGDVSPRVHYRTPSTSYQPSSTRSYVPSSTSSYQTVRERSQQNSSYRSQAPSSSRNYGGGSYSSSPRREYRRTSRRGG